MTKQYHALSMSEQVELQQENERLKDGLKKIAAKRDDNRYSQDDYIYDLDECFEIAGGLLK